MPTAPNNRVQFFISRATQDAEVAREVGAAISDEGCTYCVQDKDILPGQNFVLRMNDFLRQAEHFVLVLSQSYIQSPWCNEEWSNFWKSRVDGNPKRHMAIIRIEECEVPPLLSSCVKTDLFGELSNPQRREAIINITRARRFARKKNAAFALDGSSPEDETVRRLRYLDKLRDEVGLLDEVYKETQRDIVRQAVELK